MYFAKASFPITIPSSSNPEPSPLTALKVAVDPLTTVEPFPVTSISVGFPRIFPVVLVVGVPAIFLLFPEESVHAFVVSLKLEATNRI